MEAITFRKRRVRRTSATAVLLTTVALVSGACSSGDEPGRTRTVASVAPGAGSTSAATQAPQEKADVLAYAKCMRENGMPDFPDPQPGGGLALPSGVDPNSPEFRKTEDKCRHFMGPDQEKRDGEETWPSAEKLKYAQCMRDNGVPRFPDPDAQGGFRFKEGGPVDPQSPQFKKAEAVCAKYQPRNIVKAGTGGGP
ncbi:hypothetical protein [Streptosporangium sp. NBC_01469]|uniref:hypothetical protein n=1 Tax=Streptosporangium sp. NBC_01469 TaxID=2903898 RepID=UPI002E2A81B6|nr:hypothetical protein [Streptosporangium sp. NBC_01469]